MCSSDLGELNTSVKDQLDKTSLAKNHITIIKGGNHSAFGNYTFQLGDPEPYISKTTQQTQTTEAVDHYIDQLHLQ